jgi:hypothetical protein
VKINTFRHRDSMYSDIYRIRQENLKVYKFAIIESTSGFHAGPCSFKRSVVGGGGEKTCCLYLRGMRLSRAWGELVN